MLALATRGGSSRAMGGGALETETEAPQERTARQDGVAGAASSRVPLWGSAGLGNPGALSARRSWAPCSGRVLDPAAGRSVGAWRRSASGCAWRRVPAVLSGLLLAQGRVVVRVH